MTIFENALKTSAEEAINGSFDTDPAKDPVKGSAPDYKEYSKAGYTDRDMVYRFKDLLPYKDLDKIIC